MPAKGNSAYCAGLGGALRGACSVPSRSRDSRSLLIEYLAMELDVFSTSFRQLFFVLDQTRKHSVVAGPGIDNFTAEFADIGCAGVSVLSGLGLHGQAWLLF